MRGRGRPPQRGGRPKHAGARRTFAYTAGGVLVVTICVAASGSGTRSMAVAAGAGLVVLVGATVVWPRLVFFGACVGLALVPIVGFPAFSGFVAHPSLIAFWVIGIASLVGIGYSAPRSFSAVDVGAVLFLVGVAGTVVVGSGSLGRAVYTLSLMVGPYLAGRAVGLEHRGLLVLLGVFAVGLTGALLVPVEMAFGDVFRVVFPYSVLDSMSSSGGLGLSVVRLGTDRVQGAFAQPIPAAIILSSAALAAIAVASRVGRARRWMLAGAVVCALAQIPTLSRSGWLVIAVGGVLFAIASRGLVTGRRLAAAGFVVVAVVIVVAVNEPARSLVVGTQNSADAQSLQESESYRGRLLDTAFRPGVVRTWGSSSPFPSYNGSGSIDNEFIRIAYQFGLVALAGMLVVGFVLLLETARGLIRRPEAPGVGLLIVLSAVLVANWNVAMIGQQGVLFWLMAGAAAVQVGSARRAPCSTRTATGRSTGAPPSALRTSTHQSS